MDARLPCARASPARRLRTGRGGVAIGDAAQRGVTLDQLAAACAEGERVAPGASARGAAAALLGGARGRSLAELLADGPQPAGWVVLVADDALPLAELHACLAQHAAERDLRAAEAVYWVAALALRAGAEAASADAPSTAALRGARGAVCVVDARAEVWRRARPAAQLGVALRTAGLAVDAVSARADPPPPAAAAAEEEDALRGAPCCLLDLPPGAGFGHDGARALGALERSAREARFPRAALGALLRADVAGGARAEGGEAALLAWLGGADELGLAPTRARALDAALRAFGACRLLSSGRPPRWRCRGAAVRAAAAALPRSGLRAVQLSGVALGEAQALGPRAAARLVRALPACAERARLLGLGERAAHELGRALRGPRLRALRSLDLRANRIGPAGARALAEGVRESAALAALELGDNAVGNAGARALGEALVGGGAPALRALGLGLNRVGDAGAHHLARALRTGTALAALSLRGNYVGARGARALAAALRSGGSGGLRLLDLAGNFAPPRAQAALARVAAARGPADAVELRLQDNDDDGDVEEEEEEGAEEAAVEGGEAALRATGELPSRVGLFRRASTARPFA